MSYESKTLPNGSIIYTAIPESNPPAQVMSNGGPAFPIATHLDATGTVTVGLSLRDYFAAHASDKDIEEFALDHDFTDIKVRSERRVHLRYAFADAMLEQWEKGR